MKSSRLRLIHIHRCQGITRRYIRKFIQYDATLKRIYSLSPSSLSKHFLLPKNNAEKFYAELHHPVKKAQLIEELNRYSVITIVDENYPSVLKQIKDPPLVLYALGNISLLNRSPFLSVIGSRNPSPSAHEKIRYIIKPLIYKGFITVSGMAKGIDSFSHQLSLRHNGDTIAVLGSGFNHIYPRQNESLFYQLKEKGLILSEYPPDVPPKRYHFPERNRIISGLSFGTLVIEATRRSGTLITVDQALDQGREVYAIPDSPLIPQAKGANQMIQDGAKLVLDANDILEDWENLKESYTNS